MDYATFSGNLGNDPEVKYFESGACKAQISLALYNGKNQNGEYNPSTWVTVVGWKQVAESMAKLKKGDRCLVHARITSEHWTDSKTGENRSKLVFLAEAVGKIEKPPKTEQGQSTDYDEMPF